MIHRKKWIVVGLMIVCLISAGAFFLFQQKSLTLTVQATLYTDDAYYKREYDGYRQYWIYPNQNGSVASGWHDADYLKAAFRQGVLKRGFDYGPTSIRGSFSLKALKAHWENIPLEDDWPFQIDLYNTSSGRSFQAYMDLELYADADNAKATLYIFCENSAHPVVLTWSGDIGKEICFLCEL